MLTNSDGVDGNMDEQVSSATEAPVMDPFKSEAFVISSSEMHISKAC